MAEEPDVVEIDPEVRATLAEIEHARREIAQVFGQLRENPILHPFDFNGWVGNHPVQSSLGAAALGFMLAQSDGDGRTSSILGAVTRSGIDSLMPLLVRTLL